MSTLFTAWEVQNLTLGQAGASRLGGVGERDIGAEVSRTLN
jgi:hypothetical protein